MHHVVHPFLGNRSSFQCPYGFNAHVVTANVIGVPGFRNFSVNAFPYAEIMQTPVDPWSEFNSHEEVVVAQDPVTGLRSVIAIHSTALGPALGGTRMSLYADSPDPQAAAYSDALRLARAMSLKNSLAGLPHGGGKAVLLGDPHNKSREQLLAYGDLIESLGGKYVTAGDVGMQVADMDTVGERSRWVTGRSPENGGVGDSGILTAVGIWQGMKAAAQFTYGTPSLQDRLVAVIGAGKVGGRLIDHLITEEGARIVAMDPNPDVQAEISAAFPTVEFVDSIHEVLARQPDVLSPNAMGGFITADLARELSVTLICGGANNQLASPEVGDILAERGILYAPDFLVNCGGVIQVAEELVGANVERARAKVMEVFTTTTTVLERASSEGITPVAAAESEAWARIAAAS
jgi:valine dehydrogenase (NAD+)